MKITSNYSGIYASAYAAQQALKKEEAQEAATAKESAGMSNEDYLKQLAKLVPSVKCSIGNGLSTAKSGLTLTINPKMLEKMQNDPEQARETMELIRGVESMQKLAESMTRANGFTTVYRHGYIDENGKYWGCGCTIKKDPANAKLRKKAQENFEKRIEKSRENTRKKKAELAEKLEEKRAEKKAEKADKQPTKAERLISEKIASSKDGVVYLNDSEFREILKAIREDGMDALDRLNNFNARA